MTRHTALCRIAAAHAAAMTDLSHPVATSVRAPRLNDARPSLRWPCERVALAGQRLTALMSNPLSRVGPGLLHRQAPAGPTPHILSAIGERAPGRGGL
jgi:hypothetical protein